MKKKIFLIIITGILLLTGCSLLTYDIGRIPTNKIDNLQGLWQLESELVYTDNAYTKNQTIQFNEDGTCTIIGHISMNNGTIETDRNLTGKCYVNRIKTRLKMENEEETLLNWVKFELIEDTLVVDKIKYSRVK